jgi:hypothetical protein
MQCKKWYDIFIKYFTIVLIICKESSLVLMFNGNIEQRNWHTE